MTKIIGFAMLAATALGLAACSSESSENRTANEAADAEPQNTDYVGDIGPATQEAVSDTQAAINEASGQAGQSFEGTQQAADDAMRDANATVDQAGQELKQP